MSTCDSIACIKAPSKEIYGKSTQGTCNVEKNIQWVTTLPRTIRVRLYSFSPWWLPNVQNPVKFHENWNSWQFKVIQLIYLGVNWKRIIVTFDVGLSSTVSFFEILTFKAGTWLVSPNRPSLTPPLERTRKNFWMKLTPQKLRDGTTVWWKLHNPNFNRFLPARRYASAGNSDRNVSVCPSVRHAPVLCQNEES